MASLHPFGDDGKSLRLILAFLNSISDTPFLANGAAYYSISTFI